MDCIKTADKLWQSIKKYKFALLVMAVGILFMMIPVNSGQTDSEPIATTEPTSGADITDELTQILSQIRGVGKVKVMLTVSAGELTVFQHDEDQTLGDNGSVRKDTVIVTDSQRNESGLILQTIPPVYRGALIVCEGGDQPSVCLAVVEAVSKVTGLGSDRISVLKMK